MRGTCGRRARRVSLLLLALLAVVPARTETPEWEGALSLYNARQYGAARAAFLQLALSRAPDVDLDYFLGRLALWFNDDGEALSRLERAAAAAPRDARIQNALGDAYGLRAQDASLVMKAHWACKCRAAYQAAITLDPRTTRYRFSLIGFCLMAPKIVGGGIETARAQADALTRLDPMSGRIAHATIDLAQNDAATALARFDAVLRQDPDDYLALYHVGRCAAVSGKDLQRGEAALRRCLELPRPERDDLPTRANIHQRLGDIAARLGDPARAAAEYEQVRSLEPDFRAIKWQLRY